MSRGCHFEWGCGIAATFVQETTHGARRKTPIRGPAVGGPMTDYTTVSIPKDLAERVEETIDGTSFSSTSDLVRFLLRSIVVQHQREGQLSEAEFQDIADQLRDLGYLE
jgi:Arc/MetJ-type ribon-helix-helix transcriptional regulator